MQLQEPLPSSARRLKMRKDRDGPRSRSKELCSTSEGWAPPPHRQAWSGGAESFLHPLDAFGMDVGTPELPVLGLGQKMPERTTGAAAEVQDTLSRERPVIRQQADQTALGLGAHLLVDLLWLAPLPEVEYPTHELERRIRVIPARVHRQESVGASSRSCVLRSTQPEDRPARVLRSERRLLEVLFRGRRRCVSDRSARSRDRCWQGPY